jgi:hypothetical protein
MIVFACLFVVVVGVVREYLEGMFVHYFLSRRRE